MPSKNGFIVSIDNILLNNYWRKFYTYIELGWDESSIHDYLSRKENIIQVASFNTRSVSFSASSRRNRFYEVYNRENMLDQDVPWEGAVEGINTLVNSSYQIFVISSRPNTLEQKTQEVLARLGFPIEYMKLFFKKPTDKLYLYRKKTMEKIGEICPKGVGICLNPSDRMIFDRFGYYPIAFTSQKKPDDFKPSFNTICNSWPEIIQSLNIEKN
ncbi:MAG: hypothetical protein ACTSWC_09940 [Promethearchaeota archaeon]